MNRSLLLLVVSAALLQFGCSSSTPPDTRAADEKAIRENEAQWVKDFQAKDLDKTVAHYADDASLLGANMPIQNGKDAIRGVMKELLADPNLAMEFSPSKVEVAKGGDLAYTQGAYTMTTTDTKTKQPATEKGKYLTVYRKQTDGSWKAVEDTMSADAPAVVPKSAAKKAAPRRRRK